MFEETYDEPVAVKDMTFYSMCSITCFPSWQGACCLHSQQSRRRAEQDTALVEAFSPPPVQERLTTQIADFLNDKLEPEGVAVVLEGVHLCAMMRGVSQPNGMMLTQSLRGVFRDDPTLVGTRALGF